MKNMIGDSHWLASWERDLLIQALINSPADIVKWDNARGLSLKSGGKTDIYMSLRNARNDPAVLALLARMYENPMRRLGAKRFVEIPDAVSCFAGPLSTALGIPYVTIREQAKEGRVTKANMIGNLVREERTVMFDDVITAGKSKIIPFWECIKAGVDLGPLVVLVDRQQGWKETFQREGLDFEVWAGMTLHHVRRYLIEHGLMERCKPEVEQKNPIIVAYDGKEWEEILPMLDQLRTTGCLIKVNDMTIWEGAKNLIPDLQVYGRVMLDLKGHDIPNTLKNISRRLLKNPPWAVTVHASGGEEMIREVVNAFAGTPTKVLTVTVLTSIDKVTCEEIYTRTPLAQVKKFAAVGARGGAHGFVSSTLEVPMLHKLYPDKDLVPAGIRSEGAAIGDQKRLGTPRGATNAGASNIVMGRQIMDATDPVAEVHRILKEELGVTL